MLKIGGENGGSARGTDLRRPYAERGGRELSSWVKLVQVQEPGRTAAAEAAAFAELPATMVVARAGCAVPPLVPARTVEARAAAAAASILAATAVEVAASASAVEDDGSEAADARGGRVAAKADAAAVRRT